MLINQKEKTIMKENRRELRMEEMENVNGGMYAVEARRDRSSVKRKREARQRAEMHKRMEEAQNLADIRMRAAEDALRAAMRIDAQERAIKEQMAANRPVFD